MVYLLAIAIAASLASAQALWGSAVKKITQTISSPTVVELVLLMVQNYRFWIGAFLYAFSTVLYFLLLSKAKFFSVQVTMTGVAIVMALLISYFFFQEKISLINLIGVLLIFCGVLMVMQR